MIKLVIAIKRVLTIKLNRVYSLIHRQFPERPVAHSTNTIMSEMAPSLPFSREKKKKYTRKKKKKEETFGKSKWALRKVITPAKENTEESNGDCTDSNGVSAVDMRKRCQNPTPESGLLHGVVLQLSGFHQSHSRRNYAKSRSEKEWHCWILHLTLVSLCCCVVSSGS